MAEEYKDIQSTSRMRGLRRPKRYDRGLSLRKTTHPAEVVKLSLDESRACLLQ